MAFKQRSAFKAKEGGSAFKEMGSVGESPMKWKFGKKVWGGVKKAAKFGAFGVGGMAASHLLGKKKSGSGGAPGGGTFGERLRKKLEEGKKKMLELEDLELSQMARGGDVRELTAKESTALAKLRSSNDNLPEQG